MTVLPAQRSYRYIVKSGAIAAVLGLSALLTHSAHQPRLLDAASVVTVAVAGQPHVYGVADSLPGWFILPDRSSAPMAPSGSDRQVVFTSLLPARRLERHFEALLASDGFALVTVRPGASRTGLTSVITAFDAVTGRRVQVHIRDGRALRAIEVFATIPAKARAKGLSTDA